MGVLQLGWVSDPGFGTQHWGLLSPWPHRIRNREELTQTLPLHGFSGWVERGLGRGLKTAVFLQSWRLPCHAESGRVPALGFGRNRCRQLGFYLPRVMKQDYPLYKHTKLCEKHLYWNSRTEERPLNAVSWHSAIAGSHVAALVSPCPCAH